MPTATLKTCTASNQLGLEITGDTSKTPRMLRHTGKQAGGKTLQSVRGGANWGWRGQSKEAWREEHGSLRALFCPRREWDRRDGGASVQA